MTQIPLSKLSPNTGQIAGLPKNPRFIRDDRYEALQRSIAELPEMLELRELLVFPHENKYVVIAGNMRYRAMKDAGYKEAPCKVLPADMPPEKLREITIKDNVGYGQDDHDELANSWDLEELKSWGMELPDWNVGKESAEEDNYAPPAEIETDIVLGDLFEIGEHRLLCGDSTDSDAVARLMNGEKADMIFTDPPYGINIGNQSQGKGGGVARKNDYGVNEWDKQIPYDAINLSLALCENVVLWGANYYADKLPPSSCWIVWDKDNGETDFADCELAWTSYTKSVKKFKWKWMGMLQEDMKNKEQRVHPTQKPVALAEWTFNEFKAGKNILDLFLGSGSTMVASQQTGRRCYGMELDPKYCQVIIDRMKKLSPDILIKRNGANIA